MVNSLITVWLEQLERVFVPRVSLVLPVRVHTADLPLNHDVLPGAQTLD